MIGIDTIAPAVAVIAALLAIALVARVLRLQVRAIRAGASAQVGKAILRDEEAAQDADRHGPTPSWAMVDVLLSSLVGIRPAANAERPEMSATVPKHLASALESMATIESPGSRRAAQIELIDAIAEAGASRVSPTTTLAFIGLLEQLEITDPALSFWARSVKRQFEATASGENRPAELVAPIALRPAASDSGSRSRLSTAVLDGLQVSVTATSDGELRVVVSADPILQRLFLDGAEPSGSVDASSGRVVALRIDGQPGPLLVPLIPSAEFRGEVSVPAPSDNVARIRLVGPPRRVSDLVEVDPEILERSRRAEVVWRRSAWRELDTDG